MSTISIALEGVGRILLNRNLSVPIYQRSYAWEEEHVSDILNDVHTAMSESAQEYFIGSIVTTNNDGERAEVADGQQRLATITILLAAIRDYFYETGDLDRANAITSDLLHKKELRTLNLIPKLRLNDVDNEFFVSRILLLPDDPKRQTEPVKPSHIRIDKTAVLARHHVKGLAGGRDATEKLTDLVQYLTDSVKVIWVRVPDDTNAFMIFETLNDRGLELAITDLLKNHLFGIAGSRLSEVQSAWVSMISALEGLEEENVVLAYLRQYWSSLHGLVREKELYSHIKKRINTQSRAVSFAADLERNAHIYAAIVNTMDSFWEKYGGTCRQHIETINTLRVTQVRPLILSILDSFKEAEAKIAIKNLVSWSVRFLVHGGLGSGPLEQQNSKAAKEVRDKKITTASKLYALFKNVLPTNGQFRVSFSTASVSRAYLARYYLRALEEAERGSAVNELVPNPNREAVTLEHILPQILSTAWSHVSHDEHLVLFKRLGNLALMAGKINADAGNDGFAVKKPFYEKSEYKLTSSLATETQWDRQAIERRQEHLAALAVKTWPLK